ncbi:DUF2798 domain-containing protein [Glaciimonas immobilis]|uniref:DUF2798 domain-containing protein n=1 Tax=Glaciimonas immobilis TaxID=728004 RepID=A0A840RSU9_9BURK|nr:DUF2798 domain-containing protein [Glaciimonas immobilis]MBB5199764.1 hypothetical protein [Glaciimonas immobilis]
MRLYLNTDQDQRTAMTNMRTSTEVGNKIWRKSRSLASMLPSFVLSGVVTSMTTALMPIIWHQIDAHFFRTWVESWLTLWPIVFPIMYLLHSPLRRLAAHISPQSIV